jgi:hypothetical protein
MTSDDKQNLAILIFTVLTSIVAAAVLLALTSCTPATVSNVSTAALSGHLNEAQSHVKGAQDYVDYSDGKAVIIRNLLK